MEDMEEEDSKPDEFEERPGLSNEALDLLVIIPLGLWDCGIVGLGIMTFIGDLKVDEGTKSGGG